jgi:hypothetical protein
MTEEFLHYVWKYRNFDLRHLQTTEGESLEILRPGEHNSDSGPDFFDARIRIGQTVWAGNVEIHLRSSDWNRHFHQSNPAYNNIILHVVHESDQLIFDKSGKPFPALELTGRIHPDVYRKYLSFRDSPHWIPCGKQAGEISNGLLELWLERLLVERLERKSARIADSLALNQNDWEASFYTVLARNFGFRINSLPFEMLAKCTPYTLLSHYRDNLFQLEALLFGQAGMLDDYFREPYVQRLQSEYRFLAHKHKLKGMEVSLWKFLRLRPLNFPTVRIAQFAGLMHASEHLFSKILELPDLITLKKIFSSNLSAFWSKHYTFGSDSPESSKELGDESVENILINTVAPFLFVYGRTKGEGSPVDYSIELLSKIKPENNHIIRHWKDIGIVPDSGGRSQALFELKESYCGPKRCLECVIGRFLLKNEVKDTTNE